MFRFTFAPEEVCRKIYLCGSLCDLRAFVVKVFTCNFTTETQSSTECAHMLFPTDSKRGSMDLFRIRSYKHFAADGAKIGLPVSVHRGRLSCLLHIEEIS